MSTIRIDLPLPPSTNRLWRHIGKRVYLDPRYVAWKRTAGFEAIAKRPGRIPKDMASDIEIRAGKPKRRMDLDNLVKPTLDLLQAVRVISNDTDVTNLRAMWDGGVEPGRMQVVVTAVPDRRPEWEKRGYGGGPV
jgi:crossover junction endodeoxyribonuclease RusA